ncbi:hypothetical protein [Geobacter sp. AOG2]|uniref:hypothetical protein n=1 Tax=Geobacter sp. AOG2 TaxID=1566347 RepID=UPI001CC47173|nr:hypothetical protein [Geobacter sp. AOG2]GFE60798.1 hypothetical protein AOG2_13860 [Geobacter sp. AOG2]
MNYWLTTHWPPYEGDPADQVSGGVWVPDGREAAATGFAEGDVVFIYHPRSGRTLIETLSDGTERLRRCQKGREGVVAVGIVDSPLKSLDDEPKERYTNGTETWWRWYAPVTLQSRSGFIPRERLATALGYKSNYNLRGLGEKHSGLKMLTFQEYETLLRLYRESTPTEPPITITNGTHPPIGGGEGPQHLALKEYVAAHPSLVLGEPDVTTFAVERGFPTGDRADIVLRDRYGRFIGLEVEVVVGSGDIIGALQAVKYRRMLEMAMGARQDDSRAVLVAHSIATDVKMLCAKYDVECREVPEEHVLAWRAHRELNPEA